MKIAVVVRQVPDLIEPLEIDASGAALDLGSASFIVNESDDHALEQAILLKEAGGGDRRASWPWTSATWTTRSTPRRPRGPTGSSRSRWTSDLPPPPRAAAAVYRRRPIKPLEPDLVLVGVQAHDELDGGLLAASWPRPWGCPTWA